MEKYGIFLMQEVYSTRDTEPIWSAEWGGRIYFSHGVGNARGVAILLGNQFPGQVLEVVRDNEGRHISLKICFDDTNLVVSNIYGFNVDNPRFYLNAFEEIGKLMGDQNIIGGDFNVVLDPELDSLNRKNNNVKSQQLIKKTMELEGWVDAFRILHPNAKLFTHFKKNPLIAARLDYFLVSSGMINMARDIKMRQTPHNDHSLISIHFESSEYCRGPGLWKLNTKLLQDEQVNSDILNCIQDLKQNYGHLDIFEWWEELKIKVHFKFQEAGRRIKLTKVRNLENLRKIYDELHKELINAWPDQVTEHAIEAVQNRIEVLEDEFIQGNILRSQVKWFKEGEKNTSYFLALEKRNALSKVMHKIICEDGTVITEQKKILNEQLKFYRNLYSSDVTVQFAVCNNLGVKISENQKLELDKDFTTNEIKDSVFSMDNNKAPGTDGLPAEFYKHFWDILEVPMYELFLACRDRKVLNESAHTGTISLLPKGNKNPNFLKNWRPLTLLNLDYKILAKLVARRLKPVLNEIIGQQQTGFLPGRQITDNIMKTMDVIAYANQKKETISDNN